MAFTYRSQPLKSIYWAASIVIILFARLPFWFLTHLSPALRPRPSWGLGRSIAIRTLRVYVDILYATSLGQNTALSEVKAEKSGLVWRLLLISPAVDWALTHAGPQSSLETNVHSDFIGSILSTGYSKRALLGKLPDEFAAKSAWISPASLQLDVSEDVFANLPKTLIIAGGAELLLDVIRTFRDRMRASLGGDGVTYIEVAGGTHDLLAIRFYEPERTETLIKVARWLDRLNTGE